MLWDDNMQSDEFVSVKVKKRERVFAMLYHLEEMLEGHRARTR